MKGQAHIQVGLGCSSEKDSSIAGQIAAEQAISQSDEPVITFLFCTDNYDQEKVWQAVLEKIGNSKLVGACVPGLFVSGGIVQNGVGVCTINGSSIEVVTCLAEDISHDPFKSGEQAGEKLLQSGITSGTAFVFPDGFAENNSILLRGLYNALGPDFNYFGGGTGDNLKFIKTYQFTDQGVTSNGLAIALVRGINFRIRSGHGWKPLGKPMMVTRASGKRVYEFDGYPAFEKYSQCLGGIKKEHFSYYGMKHPLGIPGPGGEFLIRDPLGVNDDNSIVFITEIPQKTSSVLMKGNLNDLLAAASLVSSEVLQDCASPDLVFICDCISRYLLMGNDFPKEIEQIKKNLKKSIPLFGILSFGEICNITGAPFFYNKTIVLAAGWHAHG